MCVCMCVWLSECVTVYGCVCDLAIGDSSSTHLRKRTQVNTCIQCIKQPTNSVETETDRETDRER